MVCKTCLKQSSRVKLMPDGTERCHNCGGFSEAGGARTTGILTRNRLEIRRNAIKHEGDTILPHTYNKTTRKLDVNPEFVKQFPDKVKEYFTPDEIGKSGMPKLAKKAVADRKAEIAHKAKLQESVQFAGSATKRMEKLGLKKQ